MASVAWDAERRLMTMCEGYGGGRWDGVVDEKAGVEDEVDEEGIRIREEGEDEGATRDDNEVAIRDGIRSAKATSGCGSIAIDVNDDRVAP